MWQCNANRIGTDADSIRPDQESCIHQCLSPLQWEAPSTFLLGRRVLACTLVVFIELAFTAYQYIGKRLK